jgi:rRNA-processing protein FCF1
VVLAPPVQVITNCHCCKYITNFSLTLISIAMAVLFHIFQSYFPNCILQNFKRLHASNHDIGAGKRIPSISVKFCRHFET